MKILRPDVDLDTFYQRINVATHRILMLDYDGTLSPFTIKRDEAVPYTGVRVLLSDILASGRTRLVVVSGRSIHDLMHLLAIDPLPELWGSHGWERRLPDGTYLEPDLEPQAAAGLAFARHWAVQSGFGERCEIKPASIALHWRGLDDQSIETMRNLIIDNVMPIAITHGLDLKPFDGGLELSVPGRTKGDSIRAILDGVNDVVAAYLGDDRTDEDAFEALAGQGLRVLVRTEWHPTEADVWLIPPAELLTFLRHWI